MAQIIHDVDLPNTGDGDPLRTAFVNQNEMNTELYDTKVDKVTGKDLSENDFTDELKDKLDNIQEFAEANVQPDWLQGDEDADDYIKNKPENFISYPYKAIFPFVDGNVFTMPDGVAVSDVRPNGSGSDIGWTQVGTTLTFTSYTLIADDFLVVIGFFNPANVFSPTGGGVQTITSTDLAIGVDDSDPENIVLNFGGVVTDGTTITGKGTEEEPLIVIGGGGGNDPSLITKFTSNPIPSIVGTDILVPEDETWLIDSVPYTNPTVSTIPFSYAPDGLLYFLTVVATKLNTFIGKFGTASTDPSEPIVNNDELFLTTYLISDGTIEVVIPPVNPNIYVEKESFAPLNFISSGYVSSIELDKRNNIILSGTITKTGNVIKNNSNHFVVGLPFMTTNRTSEAIEIEHMNTTGGSGVIPFFNPEELSYFLQPNEVAIWISEILNGQKIHRRVSSYINRDNVIYRSGTEVGKPVTGDVEIGDTNGISTEEIDGMRSRIFCDSGRWYINILGVDTNLEFQFNPDKGILSNKLFDIDNDEKVYLQKGHIVQLEEDVFNLELNKADLVGGLVPSSQLPAYVDDIIEGYLLSGVFYKENTHTTAITGEIGKIYVDLTTGQKSRQYRWSGTVYIQITNGLIASTDDVLEGSNLYFTTARVLSTLLTGLSLVTGGSIVSTDSVLVAFGKVQKQLNDIGTALGLKQDTLTDTNFGTFTNSVADKNTQSDTDILAYVDITTGKWVKQTFSKLVDYLKGFFQTSRIIVTSDITAVNGSVYHNNGNNTFTDPTPENNKGFYVLNVSGSPTIGGNTYSVGTYLFRYYDGTNWINNTIKKGVSNAVYSTNKTLTPMDNNDTIFMDSGTLTVNPTAQAYQNGYTIAGKSSGIANTPIVLQSATDWTYVINSNAPIASASVFAEKGGTFTIVRKANLKIFSIDGSVI